MPTSILKNARVVLPDGIARTEIRIDDGLISAIGAEGSKDDEVLDLAGSILYPGFIDVHTHGAIGVDVNSANAADFKKLAQFLAAHGTTGWMPTLVPDSDENYKTRVGEIDLVMASQEDESLAQVLGIHYEGIFANEKMCGALRPEYFKTFESSKDLAQIPRLKKGKHFTTLAPEIENGIKLIKELVSQNWIVSIGHTKADVATLSAASNAGAKHLTHFFNAMTGIHHRELGVAGWGLSNQEITFDIIADGIHVDPAMLEFAVRNKSADQVSLISDSILPTGLGDGDFEVWNESISVIEGKTQNQRGAIAGSVITMLDAVRQMLSLGFSEVDAAKMASSNPAKLLGLEKTYGSIEVGKRADLVVLNEKNEAISVFINGQEV